MEAYAIKNRHLAEDQALPEHLREILDGDLDTKLLLLRHIGQVEQKLAELIMEDEVAELCGEPYERDVLHEGRYKRWGSNPGSVRIRGERVRIRVPRVRDVEARKERPLESYRKLHRPTVEDQDKVTESILLGLSQRDYQRVARTYADSFGLSASSVSRTFQERSAKALKAFEQRNLSEETYVALLIDGKHLQERQIVLCVGITAEGNKRILGFVETTTENAQAIAGLLEDLIARGLRHDEGLLCVIDGAKGLRKAIRDVFGTYAQVQRCTWHKRENVVGHLKKKEDQPRIRRKMREAYRKDTYEEAKEALKALREELEPHDRQAANSLAEGMEETLTLHKLGVAGEIGRSLQTTNIIENVNSHLGERTRRVKRWVNSGQRQRWVAVAMWETEPRLKPISCAKHLPKLQKALSECVSKQYLESTSNRLRPPELN